MVRSTLRGDANGSSVGASDFGRLGDAIVLGADVVVLHPPTQGDLDPTAAQQHPHRVLPLLGSRHSRVSLELRRGKQVLVQLVGVGMVVEMMIDVVRGRRGRAVGRDPRTRRAEADEHLVRDQESAQKAVARDGDFGGGALAGVLFRGEGLVGIEDMDGARVGDDHLGLDGAADGVGRMGMGTGVSGTGTSTSTSTRVTRTSTSTRVTSTSTSTSTSTGAGAGGWHWGSTRAEGLLGGRGRGGGHWCAPPASSSPPEPFPEALSLPLPLPAPSPFIFSSSLLPSTVERVQGRRDFSNPVVPASGFGIGVSLPCASAPGPGPGPGG